jgi:hypothetical protein
MRRPHLAATLPLFGAGFGLTPLAGSTWILMLLWGLMVGCDTGMTAMVMGATAAGRWFLARRRLVMGLPTGSAAAGTLAAMGVCNFLGTTASGWLSDRFDSRSLLSWDYALRRLSLLFLPYAFDLSLGDLGLFGRFYGLDWIATVQPTVRLTANAFGIASAGLMYGWITVTRQIGSAAAAFGAGLVRTLLGTYNSAFLFVGLMWLFVGLVCLGAALIVLAVTGPRPRLLAEATS